MYVNLWKSGMVKNKKELDRDFVLTTKKRETVVIKNIFNFKF